MDKSKKEEIIKDIEEADTYILLTKKGDGVDMRRQGSDFDSVALLKYGMTAIDIEFTESIKRALLKSRK